MDQEAERLIGGLELSIEDAVAQDTNDHSSSLQEWQSATGEVRDFLALRRDYLRQELDCE